MGSDGIVSASYWDVASRAPAGVLAFNLTARSQRALFNRCEDKSVLDVRAFIAEPHSGSSCFRSTFNTARRIEPLHHAYRQFEQDALSWMFSTRRDTDQSWLTPTAPPTTESIQVFAERLLESDERDVAAMGRYLTDSARSHRWLAYMSIQSASAIRSLGAADIGQLRVATLRACKDQINPGTAPWRDGILDSVGVLPLTALYAFQQKSRIRTITTRLRAAGLTNVGHLVMLDDEPLRFAQRFENRTLLRAIGLTR